MNFTLCWKDQTPERKDRNTSSTSKSREVNQADTIWETRIAVYMNPDWIWLNILFSFYCVFKIKPNFWTMRGGKRATPSPMWCINSKKNHFEIICFAARHVSCNTIRDQSRSCPGFAAEHGTKQVILNQPPHQPATDASLGMPNEKPNGMPGLYSLHPALPQEGGQMVPVTQNAKRLPSHSNNLCPSPVTVCHPCKWYFSRT